MAKIMNVIPKHMTFKIYPLRIARAKTILSIPSINVADIHQFKCFPDNNIEIYPRMRPIKIDYSLSCSLLAVLSSVINAIATNKKIMINPNML